MCANRIGRKKYTKHQAHPVQKLKVENGVILCGYLFESQKIPTIEAVASCWDNVCREEQGSVAKELEFLTTKQKQLLVEIAKTPGLKMPTAGAFVKKMNLTPKGILGGIAILLKHDLIEKLQDGEIRIVDPVMEYWTKE